MNKFIVYWHKNKINGKLYIGITSNIKNRWTGSGSHYFDCPKFGKAIKKYGWDNFEHVILFDNLTKEDACLIEIKLIKEYKSNHRDFGYNIKLGGELGMLGIKHSEETRAKRSKALTGITRTEIWKKRISDANTGKKRNTPSWNKGLKMGKILSDEHYKMLSEKREIPVIRYDKNGCYIDEYKSATFAQNSLNIKHISSCCNGNRKSAGGYIWKFKHDDTIVIGYKNRVGSWNKGLKYTSIEGDKNPMKRPEIVAKFIGANNVAAKSIYLIDENNNEIKKYDCLSDAARELNVNVSNITACCKGRLKSTKGYKFKYAS